MNLKNLIGEYFSFSRKERIAIITLILLILFIWVLPSMLPGVTHRQVNGEDTTWISSLKQLEAKKPSGAPLTDSLENTAGDFDFDPAPVTPYDLFYFDPNTLSEEGWISLGVRPKTVKTIRNYLQKGGRFRTAADLRKIYGFRKEDFDRLASYVRIVIKEENPLPSPPDTSAGAKPSYLSLKTLAIEDINLADTAAFISLPGIGSKLANRIVHFRDKLGGFYSVEQVGETYGLADSVFRKIRPRLHLSGIHIKKLNINRASKEELAIHPYINRNLANALVEYRNQHGPYTSLEELKNIPLIDDTLFQKITPYLSLE